MAVSISEVIDGRDLTLKILLQLFGARGLPKISVRLWDGTLWPDEAPRSAILQLNHPGALRAMLLPGTEVGLVEAYLFDDIDILGNSEDIHALGEALLQLTSSWRKKLVVASELIRLPNVQNPRKTQRGPARLNGKPHSIARDRQAIAYHYDVSNDFYGLFLGKRMLYSCAYFQTLEDSLDQAQEQKLEHICRKLRLKPGMRLLDIGCGWGGLVIYAAQNYAVDVTGVTLSQPQVELANQRIADAGLTDRARVKNLDYREINDAQGYDAIVSVGMIEHVGAAMLPTYFTQVYCLLAPGGVFLNHGVALRASEPGWVPNSFSNAYVFPDGELLPISHTLRAAEEAGFEVRDVESLREHYALTLRHWVRNLESCHDEALAFVDEPTYRVWRVCMSYPAYAYSVGRFNLYQSLLVKSAPDGRIGLPLTREDWYRR